ncbi:MAG: hypothetical protein V1793_12960 [Pseudomonadota bacterium]
MKLRITTLSRAAITQTVFTIFVMFLAACPPGEVKGEANETLVLIEPAPGAEFIGKKPLIQCEIREPFDRTSLLVLLDGTDLTGIIEFTEKGFQVKPVSVLPAGDHTLSITGTLLSGNGFENQLSFSSRHSKTFDEAYSTSELSAVYETIIDKSDNNEGIPDSKAEVNLSMDNILRTNRWQLLLNSKIRYFDQDMPSFPPMEKGVDIINYLLTATYKNEKTSFMAATGDLQINESENTAAYLARRGGQLAGTYKDFSLSGFVVKSDQVYGFGGDMGLNGDLDHSIMGISGEARLLSDNLILKTVFVTGSESGEDFGSWSTGGDKTGDVLGFIVKTFLLERKLELDAELDFSDYDADTLDEFGSESDKACRISARTNTEIFNFQLAYDYTGPEYQVVGNQSVQKDREGVALQGSAFRGSHTVNVNASLYQDNVGDDPLYPNLQTLQFMGDYNYSGFQSFPMGLSFSQTTMSSSNEPEYTPPTKLDMLNLTGYLSYLKGNLNLNLQAGYAIQNDQISDANDTTNLSLTLTPAYNWNSFSISPSLNFNRSRYELTGNATDTFGANITVYSSLIPDRLGLDLSGTFNRTVSDDKTMDMDSMDVNTRVSYVLCKKFWIMERPSLALLGRYCKSTDRVYAQNNEEFTILLSLTTDLRYSF